MNNLKISIIVTTLFISFSAFPFLDSINKATRSVKRYNNSWNNVNGSFRDVDTNSRNSRTYIPGMPTYETTSTKNQDKYDAYRRKKLRKQYRNEESEIRSEDLAEERVSQRQRQLEEREARLMARERELELAEREARIAEQERKLGYGSATGVSTASAKAAEDEKYKQQEEALAKREAALKARTDKLNSGNSREISSTTGR